MLAVQRAFFARLLSWTFMLAGTLKTSAPLKAISVLEQWMRARVVVAIHGAGTV
jgi:hypothetical protein